MAYSEKLADRTREIIAETDRKVEEKKMFGGLCFMVAGKMCVGIEKDRMMLRLDPNMYHSLLLKEGCQPMDFTGKVMKGYVYVEAAFLRTKQQLHFWLKLALDYNLLVKPSRKQSKT